MNFLDKEDYNRHYQSMHIFETMALTEIKAKQKHEVLLEMNVYHDHT